MTRHKKQKERTDDTTKQQEEDISLMAPNVDTIIPVDHGDDGKNMDSLEPLQPRHSPPAKRQKTEKGTYDLKSVFLSSRRKPKKGNKSTAKIFDWLSSLLNPH